MKFLKILSVIIISIIAIYFIVGIFLPKTYTMTRSIVINAPDSVVYNNIADYNNFLRWNPWYKMEPSAKISISGDAGQPGHRYTWNGKNTGIGEMTIREVQPYTLIEQDLKFIKPFEGHSDIIFTLSPVPEGIKVDWTMSGENKTFLDKWMGLITEMMMGKDFENGLKDLKLLSEEK